ncbi:MAG: hypothetical protein AW09_003486 [Candidatus Accumulibacter phosphatis]|uniref:Uncharacterized protein n=1 Tax=Candidatus Accumulibacter phosphatis TaxID=327160 RepID=A0A080LUN1_9PROT|nr:MAG: hypothetical protein AW09_003486 [Candidatus Accumulibacter phosphatis]
MASADNWSQALRCTGSMARALTVRMPWMVSTSSAWRTPSALLSRSRRLRKVGSKMVMMRAMMRANPSTISASLKE